MDFHGVIYKAKNMCNNKCYIGKTKNLIQRKRSHKKDTSINRCKNNIFHNAIRKYSWNNFEWEILKECDDELMLNLMETFMIMVHKSHISENGYNMTWGGEGGNLWTNNPHKEETRKKLSLSSRGNKSFTGKKHSNETKIKMSISAKGLKKGIKLTEEHKRKIGEASKGRIPSNETRKKRSDSMKKYLTNKM